MSLDDDPSLAEWLKGKPSTEEEAAKAGEPVGPGEQSTGVKPDPTDPEPEGRLCKWPDGCTNRLPPDAHNARRYCDEHLPAKKRGPSNTTGPVTAKTSARPSTKAEDLDRVRENAQKLMEMAAVIVYITARGDPLREADSADLQRGAQPWSTSVRALAEHEEWLRKILAGGKTSERALAWLQFAVITGTVSLPILIRHKVLPEELEAVAKMAQAQSGAVAAA